MVVGAAVPTGEQRAMPGEEDDIETLKRKLKEKEKLLEVQNVR